MNDYLTFALIVLATFFFSCSSATQSADDSAFNIEIIYLEPRTNSKTIITVRNKELVGVRSQPNAQNESQEIVINLSDETIDNLQKLIKDINPCTTPYYYGDLISDDGEIQIKYNNRLLLDDRDFSRSVVPAGMKEIYKYILFLTWDYDLIPKEYGF